LRELAWMYEAHLEQAWNHTACLAALIAETHRNPDKRSTPFTAEEFHPLKRKAARPRGVRLTGELIRAQAAAWRQAQGHTIATRS
jgi:hypothetical protein